MERGGFRHFMLKEIHEQPGAVSETLHALVPDVAVPSLAHLGLDAAAAAAFRQRPPGCVRHLLARGARREVLPRAPGAGARARWSTPPSSGIASRSFRRDTLVIGITQSGETADTIAAMRLAAENGAALAAVCNVRGSLAERLADVPAGHPRRPGDRRRLDQGVHHATRRPAGARSRVARREGACRSIETAALLERAWALPYDIEGALDHAGRGRDGGRQAAARLERPLPRPRRALPARPRGRPQAQGDLVPARRGVPGRRDEARSDRAARRELPGHRAVPAGRARTRRCGRTSRRCGPAGRRCTSSATPAIRAWPSWRRR